MTLKNWLQRLTLDERERFAELSGSTRKHICYQIAPGHQRPSITLAMRMIEASRVMYPDSPRRWLKLKAIYGEDAAA